MDCPDWKQPLDSEPRSDPQRIKKFHCRSQMAEAGTTHRGIGHQPTPRRAIGRISRWIDSSFWLSRSRTK